MSVAGERMASVDAPGPVNHGWRGEAANQVPVKKELYREPVDQWVYTR